MLVGHCETHELVPLRINKVNGDKHLVHCVELHISHPLMLHWRHTGGIAVLSL